MTSAGYSSPLDSSRGSSDVNVFENVDAVLEDEDLSHESSEPISVTNSEKLTSLAKKVNEGVWKSYYHCLVAVVLINNVHYWVPEWYYDVDTSKGLLAIHFLLILVFVHLPITYMEVFLAQYTKQPPIDLWKICPIFLGYCYSLIAYSTLQSWLDTIDCCRNLLYLMETLFDQAPWLRCPPELDKKCLVVTEKTKLSMDCKLAENSTLMWCPDRGEFDFSTQLWFKSRYELGSGNLDLRLDTQWKLALCSIAHWLIVMLSVMRTIYKFGRTIYCLAIALLIYILVDLMYIFSNMSFVDLLRIAFRPPHLGDFINEEFWAIAYISTVWRAYVTTPPLTMSFFARVESKFSIAWCAVSVTCASFFFMLLKATIHGALLRRIAEQLNVDVKILSLNNANGALALMPQHFGTMPMPLMWTFYWFAMRYVLLWLHSTLVAESILESLFFKYNVRKEFRVYFVGLFCATGCIVNVVSIIKQSALPVIHLIYSRIIFAGISMMPLIESTFILLIYGLSVFVDDIHFKFGSPPSFFWRFCWRALPFILLVLYLTTLIAKLNQNFPPLSTSLWILKGALLAIIPLFALRQIVYAVYNDNLPYLFNPVFDWGPADKEARKARKRFNPKTDIRSQPERTVDYTKPRESVHDFTID